MRRDTRLSSGALGDCRTYLQSVNRQQATENTFLEACAEDDSIIGLIHNEVGFIKLLCAAPILLPVACSLLNCTYVLMPALLHSDCARQVPSPDISWCACSPRQTAGSYGTIMCKFLALSDNWAAEGEIYTC